MSDDAYEALQSACGLIKAFDSRGREMHGTGFLVAPERVATCFHVVRPAELTGSLSIEFQECVVEARVLEKSEEHDCALLEIASAPSGAAPLELGGPCGWKAEWDGYGFPVVAREAGIFLDGIVSNPKGKDDNKQLCIHLWSRQIGSGMGTALGGFSGAPVMVKGYVIGQLRRIIPELSEKAGDPARPALGMVYATPSNHIASLLGVSPTCAPTTPKPGSDAASHSANRVLELLDKWTRSGMPRESAALLTAEALVQLSYPDRALETLAQIGKSVRREQLRALALAKTKLEANVNEAIKILERLRKDGNLDAETSGILGGRYKQIWEATGDQTYLNRAFEVYEQAYERTGDSYPGINAAAMALQLKKANESTKLASAVLQGLIDADEHDLDHWQLATAGEACLLLGDIDKSKEWYARAIKRYPEARENISRMHTQARLNLKALNKDERALDDVFQL